MDLIAGTSLKSTGDFIEQSENFTANERQSSEDLCCCEYINKDKQRTHVLACCCKCALIERFIRPHQQRVMLLTFQDRLRIPWRDGAKQVSLDTLVPIVIIPLVIAIAAINAYTACIMFLSCSVFLGYAYYFLKRTLPRSKFFFMWSFWSVLYMIVLFEFTVPLMELLPEENLVLVAFVAISLCCLWKAKQRAVLNHVVQSTVDEDELPDITEEEEPQTALLLDHGDESDDERHHPSICQICRKYVQPRTNHCTVCQACILRRDHHSYWLDCCIGESNHRLYLLGLIFAELGLLLGTNLTLTAVCHPFLVVRFSGIPIMLPDDCSDVFDEYELGISFIIAIYALIVASYVLFVLLKQCFLISRGTTMSECRRGQSGNRKTFLTNWKTFIF